MRALRVGGGGWGVSVSHLHRQRKARKKGLERANRIDSESHLFVGKSVGSTHDSSPSADP